MAAEALWSSLSAGQISECTALIKYALSATDPDTMHKSLKTVAKEGSPRHARDMCYYYLNKTSRSFVRVIQELDPELRYGGADAASQESRHRLKAALRRSFKAPMAHPP